MCINERNKLFKTVNSQINPQIKSNSNKNTNSVFIELDTLIVGKTVGKGNWKNNVISSPESKA